jgi:hypothetical protein
VTIHSWVIQSEEGRNATRLVKAFGVRQVSYVHTHVRYYTPLFYVEKFGPYAIKSPKDLSGVSYTTWSLRPSFGVWTICCHHIFFNDSSLKMSLSTDIIFMEIELRTSPNNSRTTIRMMASKKRPLINARPALKELSIDIDTTVEHSQML